MATGCRIYGRSLSWVRSLPSRNGRRSRSATARRCQLRSCRLSSPLSPSGRSAALSSELSRLLSIYANRRSSGVCTRRSAGSTAAAAGLAVAKLVPQPGHLGQYLLASLVGSLVFLAADGFFSTATAFVRGIDPVAHLQAIASLWLAHGAALRPRPDALRLRLPHLFAGARARLLRSDACRSATSPPLPAGKGGDAPARRSKRSTSEGEPLVRHRPRRDARCPGSVHGRSLSSGRDLCERHRAAHGIVRGAAGARPPLRPRARHRQDRARRGSAREARAVDARGAPADGEALRNRRADPPERRRLLGNRGCRPVASRAHRRHGLSGWHSRRRDSPPRAGSSA